MGEEYRRSQMILDHCKNVGKKLTKYSVNVKVAELKKKRPHLFHGRKGSPIYTKLETLEGVNDLRNSMACGNYPVSMSDCEVCGINGDCGIECPVFVVAECKLEDPYEFVEKNFDLFDFGSDDFQEMIENYPELVEHVYGYTEKAD